MASTPTPEPLSAARTPERTPINLVPWALAAIIVLIAAAAIFSLGRSVAKPAPNTILPPDPYGNSLSVTGLTMSESTSLSGGKSTYIDGHIRNTGTKTVTAATVQVLFANDEAMPPQIETVPLSLIRTHEPYVDTQPIAAAPLAPGEDREFRLIFENINASWNQHLPEIHVTSVSTR